MDSRAVLRNAREHDHNFSHPPSPIAALIPCASSHKASCERRPRHSQAFGSPRLYIQPYLDPAQAQSSHHVFTLKAIGSRQRPEVTPRTAQVAQAETRANLRRARSCRLAIHPAPDRDIAGSYTHRRRGTFSSSDLPLGPKLRCDDAERQAGLRQPSHR